MTKNYIYSVHYYTRNRIGCTNVYLKGIYDNLWEAENRLNELIPNYEKYVNNTVKSHEKIGWINKNSFGDINLSLSANQPHSAINLFEK